MVRANQVLPRSGRVMVRTRATLARLMQVQKVRSAAWPRLGTITPSNLLVGLFVCLFVCLLLIIILQAIIDR